MNVLHIHSDASDDGWGAVLYQLDKEVPDELFFRVKPEEKRVIKYMSAPYSPAMATKPVFYREAFALVSALKKARYFVMTNPFTVTVHTDHAPLQWIRNSTKGAVTSWLLEELSGLNFRVHYLQGLYNVIADTLSRSPFVLRNELAATGVKEAWKKLFSALSVEIATAPAVWFWSDVERQSTLAILRSKRGKQLPPVSVVSPRSVESTSKYDLVLLAPRPEVAPIVANLLLSGSTPGACLVPSDLVGWIARGVNNDVNDTIKQRVAESRKISFLNAAYTWIIYRLDGHHEIYANETPTETLAEDRESQVSEWIKQQHVERPSYLKAYGKHLSERSDGLLMCVQKDKQPQVIVPRAARDALVRRVHRELIHARPPRTANRLLLRYTWPALRKDVARIVDSCRECVPAKAQFNLSHRQFSPTEHKRPFMAYGVDFYGVADFVVLTVVDMASKRPFFIPINAATGKLAGEALLERIVYQRGMPSLVYSDADPALLGRVFSGLCSALQIKRVVTRYYPQGNSTTERNHVILGEFLRLLPEKKRKTVRKELPKLELACAAAHHSSLGMSPYKFETGTDPVLPFDAAFVELPEEPVWEDTPQPGMFSDISKSVRFYREIANRHAAIRAMCTKERLNSGKSPLISFEIGDPVVIYVPRRGEDGWKQKHVIQWRRAFVVEKLSRTFYKSAEERTGHTFERHLSCMRRDRSRKPLTPSALKKLTAGLPRATSSHPTETSARTGKPQTRISYTPGSARVGDHLIVRDTPDDKHYWIAECIGAGDDTVQLHYLGTRTSCRSRNATFSRVFIEAKTGLSIVREPTKVELQRGAKPWVGTVPDDCDLILSKLTLTGSNRIPGYARRLLLAAGYFHAVVS